MEISLFSFQPHRLLLISWHRVNSDETAATSFVGCFRDCQKELLAISQQSRCNRQFTRASSCVGIEEVESQEKASDTQSSNV